MLALLTVTVFLDRDGEIEDNGVRRTVPSYAGSDVTWDGIVGCVRDRFAPFDVAIVTQRPEGDYIHAMFGGDPAMKDQDKTTGGVGPHNGTLLASAKVYIFTAGREDQIDVLCRTAAHEIAHPMGLDHSRLCSDIMSYCFASRHGYRFRDKAVPCGEDVDRDCSDGEPTQNSFRKLARLVGLRPKPHPEDPYDDRQPVDPYR